MTNLPALSAQGFGAALIQYCNDLHDAGLFGKPEDDATKPLIGFEGNTITIDLQPRQQFGVAIGHAMRLTVFDDHATLQSRDVYLDETNQLAFVGMPMSFLPDSKTNTYSPDQYKQMALLIRGKADENRAWAEDPIIDEYKIAAALTRFGLAAADKKNTNLPVTTTDVFSLAAQSGRDAHAQKETMLALYDRMREEYLELIAPYLECCLLEYTHNFWADDFSTRERKAQRANVDFTLSKWSRDLVWRHPDLVPKPYIPGIDVEIPYTAQGQKRKYIIRFHGNDGSIDGHIRISATRESCDQMMAAVLQRLYRDGDKTAPQFEEKVRALSERMNAAPLPDYTQLASVKKSWLRRLLT